MDDERSKINLPERASYVQLNKPDRRTCDSKSFPLGNGVGKEVGALLDDMRPIDRKCDV